jgi:DNA-directed RNA polymerase specialized sigma54-like protein
LPIDNQYILCNNQTMNETIIDRLVAISEKFDEEDVIEAFIKYLDRSGYNLDIIEKIRRLLNGKN